MSKITLQSRKYKKAEYKEQEITMPVLGKIKFENDGTLKVENDASLDEFLRLTEPSFDFKVVGGKGELKSVKKGVKVDPEEDEDDDKSEELREQEIEKMKAQLDGMNDKELLELVKETKISPAIAAAWTPKRLKSELLKRLTAE